MAGIGFELQRLLKRDDLAGPTRGYLYAAAVVVGPWLVTVAAIAIISAATQKFGDFTELPMFRTIVLYNFSISLALSSPVAMIATRFLADRIYDGDDSELPGMVVGATALALATQMPVALVLYFAIAELSVGLALLAIANYAIVTALWIAAVFLTTLKDYAPVVFAFAFGLGAGAYGAILLDDYGVAGKLAGFTAGLALTLFILLGRGLVEFQGGLRWPRRFFAAFRMHPELALAALAYNAGIWIDKWILWLSPASNAAPAGLPVYPAYDGAMFFAHLTLAPGLAVFFALVETGFFERYRRFYGLIHGHGTLRDIREAHGALGSEAGRGVRLLTTLHIAIAAVALMLAPVLTELVSLNAGQIGIFRLGVAGTAAHAIFLYALILLAYFDLRRAVLRLSAGFLALNGLLTLASLSLGFRYYGAGYLLAALISAAAAAAVASRELKRLPYLTFIGNNPSTGRRL